MLHLEVYGEIWSGARAVYSYTPKASAADIIANPQKHAGDFANVLDFRVVEETNAYEGSGAIKRRIDTFKTLRGFRNGMTPRRFYRLANGV